MCDCIIYSFIALLARGGSVLLEMSINGNNTGGCKKLWTSTCLNEQIVQQDICDQHLYKLGDACNIVTRATIEGMNQENYRLRRIETNPNCLSIGYASNLLNDIINIKEKNGKNTYSSTNHSNLKMQYFF